MDVKWIDQELDARGLPRKVLADVIPGWTETKVSLVMSGKRKLSADEADAIRHFFGYTLPDDPPTTAKAAAYHKLARLSEKQAAAVLMYLDALTG